MRDPNESEPAADDGVGNGTGDVREGYQGASGARPRGTRTVSATGCQRMGVRSRSSRRSVNISTTIRLITDSDDSVLSPRVRGK